MKSLYLAEWNTFIRYHEISGKGKTLVFLPGLSMPAVEQFLSVVTHADMTGLASVIIPRDLTILLKITLDQLRQF